MPSDLPAELAAAKERVAEIEKQIADEQNSVADWNSFGMFIANSIGNYSVAADIAVLMRENFHRYVASEAATETKPPILEVLNLRDLVQHCWVHSAYERCGYDQMTTEQKDLFESITEQSADELLEQIDAAKAVATTPLDAEKLAGEIWRECRAGNVTRIGIMWHGEDEGAKRIADIIRKHTNQEGPDNG